MSIEYYEDLASGRKRAIEQLEAEVERLTNDRESLRCLVADIDRVLTNDPNPFAIKTVIAWCRKALEKK